MLALVVVATLAGAYLFYRAMPAYSGDRKAAGSFIRSACLARRPWRPAHLCEFDGRRRTRARLSACKRTDVPDGHPAPGRPRAHGRNPRRRSSAVDKFIRTLGFYREAETSFSALSPWAQKRLEAYAEGVNAFLASHPLPPEFLLAGDQPRALETGGFAGDREDRGLPAVAELQAQAPPRPPYRQARRGTGKLALSRRAARRSCHDPSRDQRHPCEQRQHR